MAFKLALFDADHTLFDFDQSEEEALTEVLTGILKADACQTGDSANYLQSYREISRELWGLFEKSAISQAELKVRRFHDLFARHKITANPEIVAELYLDKLALHAHVFTGAEVLLIELNRRKIRIGIVTNGIERVQLARIKSSRLSRYIEFLVVSERAGCAKPNPQIFKYTLDVAKHFDKHTVLMVGDRLETDILGANAFGISSCWYNPERKPIAPDLPESHRPNFEVHHLSDILGLF
jgi:2-haloacid dehalogenase